MVGVVEVCISIYILISVKRDLLISVKRDLLISVKRDLLIWKKRPISKETRPTDILAYLRHACENRSLWPE